MDYNLYYKMFYYRVNTPYAGWNWYYGRGTGGF